QYVDKPPAVADAPVAVADDDVVVGGAVDEEEDIFADAGVDYQVNDENENENESEAVTAPYPDSDDGDEGVTAPYPEPDDIDEGVTAPYPESEDEDEGVTAPYPASEGEEDEVTAPYPASEDEEVVAPVGNPDNDIGSDDDNDATLFSMARSRFKEETSELLSRQQPDSTQSTQSAKRKAATLQSNEWNKTQRILQTKYQQK
ncbi:hypothetical protein GGI16_003519, partial [Coemansia sp. S142-1]